MVLAWVLAAGMGAFASSAMAGHSHVGHPEDERVVREYLERHVTMLAGDIGERNLWHPRELDAAAEYIERVLEEIGYAVGRQEFESEGFTVANVEAELAGTSKPEELVVVGAHYDSVVGSPGANDNATGVAALLEIARRLSGERLSRTVRFVAFVNEEPPFSRTDAMGSRRYAARARERKEAIVAMLSLETIGCYSDEKKSQHYPFPLALFHPNTGNFIGFVGNLSSRRLVRRVHETFERHSDFPSEWASAPSWVTGIGWSDHWAFWKEGYPAIMVTDTALFRYAHYHTMRDTPDKIDYARFARVTQGLTHVVRELAGE